jgi:hypothetical protein
MTPCDNCIHRPICNIWEDYRQLLVDTEPLKKKNPAFEVMANCKYFRIDYKKTEPETIPSTININLPSIRGNEEMNRL